MKKIYYYADFPEAVISSRVASALTELPAKDISVLISDGKISTSGEFDTFPLVISPYCLSWEHLDAYANACNVSLSQFIYGDDKPAQTFYSYFDDAVIPLLNVISPVLLDSAAETVCVSFPNPKFRISRHITPSSKFLAMILTYSRNPKAVLESEQWKYTTNINEELTRFRNSRKKERFVFHLDYILDLCTYWKLSPHFVFSLTGSLLCQTAQADAFFDLYCLLNRQQQISVLAMLLCLCPDAQNLLPEATWNRIQGVIAEEGKCVSCQ